MKNNIWHKKIPTLLGILLIVVGVGLTSYLARQGVFFVTKAGPGHTPKDVRITNVTDTSATVSYITDDSVVGSLKFGKTKELGSLIRDDRDQDNGKVNFWQIHSITIRNLNPSTKYYFSILSKDDTFLNNGSNYEFQTGPKIEADPNNQAPATGKVITVEGTPPKESIVYLTTKEGQVISALTKSDGSYVLPLNSFRNNDLSSYFSFTKDNKINLLIKSEKAASNALLTIDQINPIPTITLTKNYNFLEDLKPTDPASSSAETESTKEKDSFPVINTEEKSESSLEVTVPKEKETFTDQQPLFKGSTLPNQTVTVIIHSDENIEAEIISDRNGNWQFRPDKELSPGEHTITIISKDSSGFLRTVTKSFTIFFSGTQVAESATPSATPTLIPTLTPTSTPFPTNTPSPTVITTPTVTVAPTLAPTEVLTPTPTMAPPGNPLAFNLGLAGIGATVLGIILLAFGKGIIPIK